MKTTVSKQHFIDAFLTSSYRDNFSYDGLKILFDYLEEMENDCDIELELDVVAIACDYSEMSVTSIAQEYQIDYGMLSIDDDATDHEIVDTVRDYLQDNTQVCGEYENDGISYFVFCSSF